LAGLRELNDQAAPKLLTAARNQPAQWPFRKTVHKKRRASRRQNMFRSELVSSFFIDGIAQL